MLRKFVLCQREKPVLHANGNAFTRSKKEFHLLMTSRNDTFIPLTNNKSNDSTEPNNVT